MNTVVILQARLNSTRLPGKMLLPLLGKPLVQHVMERVARATLVDDVVLAVPVNDANTFAPLASGRAWLYSYAGDEADLVGRYLAAAEVQRADLIVRVPCDNPCVDPDYIDEAVAEYLKDSYAFYSTTVVGIPQPEQFRTLFVDGLGCEVFSVSRLKWLDQITRGHAAWREHPHQWFHEKLAQWYMQGDCGIHVNLISSKLSSLRLDVNTQEDYDVIRAIFDHFGHNHFTAAQIVAYLSQKEEAHAPQARVQSESH